MAFLFAFKIFDKFKRGAYTPFSGAKWWKVVNSHLPAKLRIYLCSTANTHTVSTPKAV